MIFYQVQFIAYEFLSRFQRLQNDVNSSLSLTSIHHVMDEQLGFQTWSLVGMTILANTNKMLCGVQVYFIDWNTTNDLPHENIFCTVFSH